MYTESGIFLSLAYTFPYKESYHSLEPHTILLAYSSIKHEEVIKKKKEKKKKRGGGGAGRPGFIS